MKGFLIVTFFLVMVAQNVFAETIATPASPSLQPEPSSALDRTGIRMTNQGCQYGGQRASATYVDDFMIKEVSRSIRDNAKLKQDYEKKLYSMESALSKSKEELGKILGELDVDTFVAKAGECSAAFRDFKRSEKPEADKNQQVFNLFKDYKFVEQDSTCGNLQTGSFSECNADAARCKRGFDRSGAKFDFKHMCYGVTPNDGKNAAYKKGELKLINGQIESLNSEAKVSKCGRLTLDIIKKQDAFDKLAKEIANREEKDAKFKERLEEEQEKYQERVAEARELGLDQVSADGAGVRDCPEGDGECLVLRAKQMRSESNNIGKWLFAGAIADSAIQVAANINIARRNANLGYPTGPNHFISPMVGVLQSFVAYNQLQNMGYPFNYGGVYGGTIGGAGAGTWGCSPGAYGAAPFSTGPAASQFGPLFNGGFIPGFGQPGPGYMNGGGGFNPQAMQCMMSGANCGGFGGINSIMNGLFNPLGQYGLAGNANAMGYPGMPYYGGGPGGFFNGAMGGFPGAFGGGYPGAFGGQFGGPGAYGGFPGGYGGFPGAFGGGYPGAFGGQFGGPGGFMNNPLGINAANAQAQMFAISQQLQQMQAYQAQMQDSMQRYTMFMQLQQQSYSILGSGSGGAGFPGGASFGPNMNFGAGVGFGVNPAMATPYPAPIAGSMPCMGYQCSPPNAVGNPGGSNR